MRALLDTSVLVGPRPEPIQGELAISSVSLAELHFGVLTARSRSERAERLRRLAVVEAQLSPLPVDQQLARAYGRIAAAVVARGRQPRSRAMDLLIAATAAAHDARLFTRNAADFVGLHDIVEVVDLGREDPPDAAASR